VIVEDTAVPGAGGSECETPCAAEIRVIVRSQAGRTKLQARAPSVVGLDRGRQNPGLAAAGVVAGGQPAIKFAQCRSYDRLRLDADSLSEKVNDAFWRQIVEILIKKALA
jgi:hypothetical protein